MERVVVFCVFLTYTSPPLFYLDQRQKECVVTSPFTVHQAQDLRCCDISHTINLDHEMALCT